MKNNSIFSTKNNGFDGQFKNLNNNDMLNLKGGDLPPYPTTGGEDYPIDLLKKAQRISMSTTTIQLIPVL